MAHTGVQQSPDIASTEENRSVFLEKVSDIPVVNVAKEITTAAYNHVKQMNPVTQYALSKAESTLLYFALASKPVLEKVQPQAKIVDDMACRTLEAVELKAPFIRMTPEEMVDEARKLCSVTLGTGLQKVEGIKTMGTDALSSVKNYGLQKANDYLTGTENLVDKYLPPSEKDSENKADKSVSERATQLTTKVSQHVYGQGVKQFVNMQKLSQDSIDKLLITVQLMQNLKENYSKKSIQECVDEAKVKATWIWTELNKEPAATESTEANKSLEHRLVSLARRITSTLVHTYSATTVPLSELPQACLDGVGAARAYAADLFTQFDQAIKTGEVATTVLTKTLSTINVLEGIVKTMLDNFQDNESFEMQALKEPLASEGKPNE